MENNKKGIYKKIFKIKNKTLNMNKIMYIIIKTTTQTKEEAQKIMQILLNKKLAACIQVKEIESFYIWEGQFNNDKEYELSIKTKNTLYKEIEKEILTNHSYKVPQILVINISDGYNEYLKWINEELDDK